MRERGAWISGRYNQTRESAEHDVTRVLSTPRLVLREMGMSDLDFIAMMMADPEVMLFYPRRLSRKESEAWVRRQQKRYATDGFGLWLAVDARTDTPIGQAGLVLQEVDGVMEPGLGYLVHRPFWRRGFATEAADATIDHAFAVLGLSRVICTIRPENIPSLGVVRKLGMKQEKSTVYAGFDHLVFSTTATDRTDMPISMNEAL